MNKHKLRRRAYRQGVQDRADRSLPVYLAQIARARQEAAEATRRAEYAEAQLVASASPSAHKRAEAAEKRVTTLETFTHALIEASGAPCAELLWDTVSKTAERARQLDADCVNLRASNARLVVERDQLQASVKELEASDLHARWQKARKWALSLEVDISRLWEAAGLTRGGNDVLIEHVKRLQSTIDRTKAAGWCDYSDSDDVARGLQGEDAEADTRRLDWLERQQWFLSVLDDNIDWKPTHKVRQSIDAAMGVTLPQAGEAGEP